MSPTQLKPEGQLGRLRTGWIVAILLCGVVVAFVVFAALYGPSS